MKKKLIETSTDFVTMKKTCRKCGAKPYSYDRRFPTWMYIVLRKNPLGHWYCNKCFPSLFGDGGRQTKLF